MHQIKHTGDTLSPNKAQICRKEVVIVGQECTSDERKLEYRKVEKILKWLALALVKKVHSFLGSYRAIRI